MNPVTKVLKPWNLILFHFPFHMIVARTFVFHSSQAAPAGVSFSTHWTPTLCLTRGEWQFLSHLQHSVVSLGVSDPPLPCGFSDLMNVVSRCSLKKKRRTWVRKNIVRLCQNTDLFFYFFGQYDLFWTTFYSRISCFTT